MTATITNSDINARENKRKKLASQNRRANDLLGAAKRYVAVADWYERRGLSDTMTPEDQRAAKMLNRAEADLRRAGGFSIGSSFMKRRVLIEDVARLVGASK